MKIFNRRNIIFLVSFLLMAALYLLTEARYVALIMLVMILMIIGSVICILLTGKKLEVSIECPVQGFRNEKIPVKLLLDNKSRLPVLMTRANLEIRNMLTDEKHKLVKYMPVRSRKQDTIEFDVEDKFCGCMEISLDRLAVTDPFCILGRKAAGFKPMTGKAYIMPERAGSEFTSEEINSFDMESYKYSSTQKGNDPSEVFNIKEYEKGDSIKSIHWKLSTKTDSLLIKESSLPIENKVMLIVEKMMDKVSPELADEYTGFAASLSYTLLRNEQYHTIGWYDHNSQKFESFRVDSDDSYWLAMKGLVECPYREDGVSAVDSFIETDIIKEFSNYILISEDNRNIEELATYGTVTSYKPEDYN